MVIVFCFAIALVHKSVVFFHILTLRGVIWVLRTSLFWGRVTKRPDGASAEKGGKGVGDGVPARKRAATRHLLRT